MGAHRGGSTRPRLRSGRESELRGRRGEWLSWARTPGHDAYWHYREAFFALLPAAAGSVLEVGCGEGRVARDLAARGYRVTGLDASATLVAAAAERDPGGRYAVGAAEALPFADDSFDLVVAYNSLLDVEDMPSAIGEAPRVLRPGGRLCACVTHPVADGGGWEDGRFVLSRSYRRGGPFRMCASGRPPSPAPAHSEHMGAGRGHLRVAVVEPRRPDGRREQALDALFGEVGGEQRPARSLDAEDRDVDEARMAQLGRQVAGSVRERIRQGAHGVSA